MNERQRPYYITNKTGETRTLADWARTLDVPYSRLRERMTSGCTDAEILSDRHRRGRVARSLIIDNMRLTVRDWSKFIGTPTKTIYSRLNRGWSEHDAVYGKAS